MLVGGFIWALQTIAGVRAGSDEKWAKANFLISVNYLMVVFLVMVLDTAGRPFF